MRNATALHRSTKPRQSDSAALGSLLLLLLTTLPLLAASPGDPINYAPPEKLGELQSKLLDESSGLACSRRSSAPGSQTLWWTHNDSGDGPFLYALGPRGEDRGRVELQNVFAIDWEDMCSFTLDNHPYLLAADTGDNLRKRRRYSLYILGEPDAPGENKSVTITHFRTVHFEYPHGQSYNCEAVAVDSNTHVIYLVTKRWFINDDIPTRVFRIPLPDPAKPDNRTLPAEQIGQLDLSMVTAMDLSPDGRRAVVLTMTGLYEFSRKPDEDWPAAFKRPPRSLPLPILKQAEAVAFATDGLTIQLTTEQRPALFYQIAPAPPSHE
ncbi:MAG: hypothetical protein WC058_13635 [Phycisphaeraceae bacterium]